LTFLREKVDLFEQKGQPSLGEASTALKAITITLLSATCVHPLICYKQLGGFYTLSDYNNIGNRLIMTIPPNVGIVSRQIKRLNSTIELSPFYIIIWNYQNTISKDLFMV